MERNDFLGQYRAIQAKLKKRFLRKPNVAEASLNFSDLAKELENNECPHYAAFCLLAVARCENTLGNAAEESQTLVRAARLYLEAEHLNHELMCPSVSENLNAALSCYNDAIKIHQEHGRIALAASLCMETGNALRHLGRLYEAVTYFERAARFQNTAPLNYIHSMEQIAQCKIKLTDYDCALDALTDVCTIAEAESVHTLDEGNVRIGGFAAILSRCEISRVLLLVLLHPPPQKLKPENAKLLEKYTWEKCDEDQSPVNYINEDLFLLLQSFVMASQSKDNWAMKALEPDLWPHLDTQQLELLHLIIEKLDD